MPEYFAYFVMQDFFSNSRTKLFYINAINNHCSKSCAKESAKILITNKICFSKRLGKTSFMSKEQVKLYMYPFNTHIKWTGIKNTFVWYQQNVGHAKFIKIWNWIFVMKYFHVTVMKIEKHIYKFRTSNYHL